MNNFVEEENGFCTSKKFRPYGLLAMGVIKSAISDGDVKFFESDISDMWFGMAECVCALPKHKCLELAKEVRNQMLNEIEMNDIFALAGI